MPTEAETVAAVMAAWSAAISAGRPPWRSVARESGGALAPDLELRCRRERGAPRPHPAARSADAERGSPGQALGKAGNERSIALDRATEFRVLAAAHKARRSRARVLFELTASDGLGEAYVMRRIRGPAIARKLLRDPPYAKARGRIAGQLGEILARIHATAARARCRRWRTAKPPTISRALRRQLDLLGQPQPVFELALAWLDRRKPAPTQEPVLVHGDYRTGNYLADETGVTAILDWEGAHLGDPIEDLGWLCVKSWRFGAVDKPAGGFGSREELWAAYQRAGGAKVDPARAHWWEVFGTARWGIICHNQAFRHLSGSIKSMELASIGRRAVETEVDLLQLLKSGG